MDMVFGGAEPKHKKRPSATMVTRTAQHFQLDQCLSAKAMDKIINTVSVADARQKNLVAQKSNIGNQSDRKALSYDVDGFAKFLADNKAISTLLFWKEVEDFTTLFGVQERAKAAEKIFERYLKEGAEYEVCARCGPAC